MSSASGSAGQFVWHELNTSNPDRAKAFYGEVFGWRFETVSLGKLGDYTMFGREEHLGGIAPVEGDAPPHWLTYISVDDVDATAKRVPLLGGKVAMQPMEIPNVGRVAVVTDPDGATFAIFKPAKA